MFSDRWEPDDDLLRVSQVVEALPSPTPGRAASAAAAHALGMKTQWHMSLAAAYMPCLKSLWQLPLPCVSTAFAAKTLHLPCASTAR